MTDPTQNKSLHTAIAQTIEQELSTSNERNTVIVCAALLDTASQNLLMHALAKMSEPDERIDDFLFHPSGPLGSFGARIRLGKRMGLFNDDVYQDLKAIESIRNDFAHNAFVTRGQHQGRALSCDVDPIRSAIAELRVARWPAVSGEIDPNGRRVHHFLTVTSVLLKVLSRAMS